MNKQTYISLSNDYAVALRFCTALYLGENVSQQVEALEFANVQLNKLGWHEVAEVFDEALNDDGEVEIAGIYFERAKILKDMDERAYNMGVNDFIDGYYYNIQENYIDFYIRKEDIDDIDQAEVIKNIFDRFDMGNSDNNSYDDAITTIKQMIEDLEIEHATSQQLEEAPSRARRM